MMKLSIGRCNECSRVRLVDVVANTNMCFACKQGMKRKIKAPLLHAA